MLFATFEDRADSQNGEVGVCYMEWQAVFSQMVPNWADHSEILTKVFNVRIVFFCFEKKIKHLIFLFKKK